MKYTLYIDESGDFESQRGQWLISGVLFSESYRVCENTFTTKFKSAPAELNLKSIKQFHLTEFRKEFGHDKAVGMANQFLKKLNNLPFDHYCLAAINYSKHSLSSREKTYRLMLSDLLALCDTVLPEGEVISNLDLIIATRTIDGELQTSISNVNQDIINSLPLALEVDLTSKGMVELIGKHLKVHMDYANNSWGLVTADFIANLNYHHHHKNEKELLEQLASQGRFSRFESFGNYEERRANIAKRNGDLITALYRWLVIHSKEQTTRTEIAIQSVLFKVFNTTGTTGYLITFEAVIERLWRSFNTPDQYHKVLAILKQLSIQLSKYDSQYKIRDFNNIIFKLRNLILIIDNHLGETQHALQISQLQNELVNRLGSNPDFFPIILDFKISEIETYINLLEFEQALNLSNKFSELISSYNDIWTLLLDDVEQSEFDSSRACVKSKMTSIRCNILCLEYGVKNDELIKEISELENIISNKGDISRLFNYKVMYLLKTNQPLVAVNNYLEILKNEDDCKLGIFDIFWFLRATNDALLNGSLKNTKELIVLIEAQISFVDLNSEGHPFDLILRELALFEFQNSNKSKALKYIKRSSKACNLGESEIANWLSDLNRLHENFFNGLHVEESKYFNVLANTSFLCKVRGDKDWSSVLKKYRFYSPY
ncbi:hypothetical protein [Thalassotalea castellviae]|uniref:DUF3800 domain-containing protein n=1 Tax=Thalassotalea castellviae TaxID=3075612 RepID=A0ABU2ZVN6_9GAMM|nr:hypothetical protein [Thalassotalea sp. W431]MDT0602002.1 hypothetical protein [Thalassotalea sp. W431]